MSECCGPLLAGATSAPTAERLMRSRYSAFATSNADYLMRTWHPDARPRSLDLDDGRRWTGLEIVGVTGGGMLHTTGTVEFVAHYRDPGSRGHGSQRENSAFSRVDGKWVYVGVA
ncbi:MAG: YchJ family metal-binding protein [Rhodococcus sp. (in: high G+C Gram-positive bacteria)]